MTSPPVLILGAGINGAALARELALNGVPVYVVDRGDLASGTTAYSSRLIHGGLRYLEYGDFALVRESLAERTRLLHLAGHLVRPLPLFVPIERGNRLGGTWAAIGRLLGRSKSGRPGKTKPRGLWLVRAGLWFYDRYARDPDLPRHSVHSVTEEAAVPVDGRRFGWECAFHDAQLRYPERFVVDLLEDARRMARQTGSEFQLLTYHQVDREGVQVELRPVDGGEAAVRFVPAAVVNATGAWVDDALRRLEVPSPRLMGGTKGSHLLTSHAGLVQALAGRGLYTEADDGRPIFVLPWGRQVLIGTTDLPFEGDPADAVATPDELKYLVAAVNRVLPQAELTAADIDMHYCGVRPLPYVDSSTPSAVTRRHWTHEHADAPWPLFSEIGGKLTTCRSLAEETAKLVLNRLGLPLVANSRQRPLPGGVNFPAADNQQKAACRQLAEQFQLPDATVEAACSLLGTRASEALAAAGDGALVPGTPLPRAMVQWVIEQEWPRTLDDLVERRLMLLYEASLNVATLRDLARLLAEAGHLSPTNIEASVAATVHRLRTHFGKVVK
ncbi:MAG: glycerol-3-phosphate dehydrogenase/oxidase [Pirellulales bacterium]